MISEDLNEHIKVVQQTIITFEDDINAVAKACIDKLNAGGKIIIFGNGGSAADAQHMAAEIVGNFSNTQRRALPAIALTTDTSVITSISNDFSFEKIFVRQLEAIASKKDIIIGISTSGTSKNIISALKYAKELNSFVVGLSGENDTQMKTICDINIAVHSNYTPRIQETHLFIEHCICDVIDTHFIN